MRLPGVASRAVDVPHMVGAVSARVIRETPTTVTVAYKVPTGGSIEQMSGMGELDGFFKDVWRTFKKIIPYAAPIAGAIIPQVFPEAPWYLKAIPTGVAALAPKPLQTMAITAGATVASEAVRRFIAPTAPAPDVTGTLPPVGTVINGANVAVQMPSGAIQTVPQFRLPDLLKIGATVLGTIGAAGAVDEGPPPMPMPMGPSVYGAPYGDPYAGGYPGGGGPMPAYDPRLSYLGPEYYMPGVAPSAPGYPPPGPTTEFLPAPGVRPPPLPPPGGISWTTLALIGLPLAAVAIMSR